MGAMSRFLPSFGKLRATPDPERQKLLDKALFEAVNSQDLAAVKVLLAAGADANTEYIPDGPLREVIISRAYDHDSIKIVRALLAAGASLNRRMFYGAEKVEWPLLRDAVDEERVDTFQVLIEAGAKVEDEMLPATAAKGNLEMVQALIAAGANVNARNSRGKTALSAIHEGEKFHVRIAIEEVLRAAGATK